MNNQLSDTLNLVVKFSVHSAGVDWGVYECNCGFETEFKSSENLKAKCYFKLKLT